MELLPIGFGNYCAAAHIVSIVSPDSAPVKRLIAEYRERGCVVDASFGRSTRAVLVMDSGHLVLSAQDPETLSDRAAALGDR